MKMPSLLMAEKNRAKFLLMEKAVVTLLIRSFKGWQEKIAHYLYALSFAHEKRPPKRRKRPLLILSKFDKLKFTGAP